MTKPKTDPKPWLLGSLSPSKDGANYILPQQNFPEPTRICNASARGIYTGPAWNTREGSEIHRSLPSRGIGC